MMRIVCMTFFLSACSAFAQEAKRDDAVEKSIAILERAIKDAKTSDEKFRLTRALLAIKTNSKPIKALDVSKEESWMDGDLRYSFSTATHINGSNSFTVRLQVWNKSATESIGYEEVNARFVGGKMMDDTGAIFVPGPGSPTQIRGGPKLSPGDKTPIEYVFKGVMGEKCSEVHLELPHVNAKPDIVLVIPVSLIKKK